MTTVVLCCAIAFQFIGQIASEETTPAQHWYATPEWWLVGVGILTLLGILYQARETAVAARAAADSVHAVNRQVNVMESQSGILAANADAARDNAKAAELNAQTLVNTERAWIMAELGWYDRVQIGERDVRQGDGPIEHFTDISAKLTCRNTGRSPAWIENVRAQLEIVRKSLNAEPPAKEMLQSFGPMEPLGAGDKRDRSLQLTGSGHATSDDFYSVYVIVEYRDIFGVQRETTLGYSIRQSGEIGRQFALPQRNRYT